MDSPIGDLLLDPGNDLVVKLEVSRIERDLMRQSMESLTELKNGGGVLRVGFGGRKPKTQAEIAAAHGGRKLAFLLRVLHF